MCITLIVYFCLRRKKSPGKHSVYENTLPIGSNIAAKKDKYSFAYEGQRPGGDYSDIGGYDTCGWAIAFVNVASGKIKRILLFKSPDLKNDLYSEVEDSEEANYAEIDKDKVQTTKKSFQENDAPLPDYASVDQTKKFQDRRKKSLNDSQKKSKMNNDDKKYDGAVITKLSNDEVIYYEALPAENGVAVMPEYIEVGDKFVEEGIYADIDDPNHVWFNMSLVMLGNGLRNRIVGCKNTVSGLR